MSKKKKKIIKRLIIWFIVLLVLGIAGLMAWFVWIPQLKAEITVTYDTYTATIGTISNSLSFSGSVSVINSGYATASKAGTVRTLYVADGDNVKEGDKLARMSTGEIVRAPFDGTINDLLTEEGKELNAGGQIAQVVDFANMKVTMRVDEYDISDVYVGQDCRVTFTALEKTFPSRIMHINRLSQSSGSVAYYQVTATVEVTEEVLPGMQVTVSIPREEAVNAVILKMDALSFARDNSAFVYQMDENGELIEVPVTVGVDNGNYVEITSGLSAGDTVYVEVEVEQTGATGLAGLVSALTGGNAREIRGGGGTGSFGGRSDFSGMNFSNFSGFGGSSGGSSGSGRGSSGGGTGGFSGGGMGGFSGGGGR